MAQLRALGYADRDAVPLDVLAQYDQLHYHGTQALDAAVTACHIKSGDRVLEVGSGWGGCARHIAHATGAQVTAVELQGDYDKAARDLTRRTGLSEQITHINADFLVFDPGEGTFDHAVSWLALFHIPRRADYLARIRAALRPGGALFAEDLFLITPVDGDEAEDFQRHLFPNSLVSSQDYRDSLDAAGLKIEQFDDMTQSWAAFTADRLDAFHADRAAYQAVHGADGYRTIETFYSKMAGYFARGIVGGVRVLARAV